MYGLKSETLEHIIKTIKRCPAVDSIILYGSRAKGNYKNGSDIDITLKGDKLDLPMLYKIENSLDDLMLPYKIDLSLYAHIKNSNLVEHIDRVGKELSL